MAAGAPIQQAESKHAESEDAEPNHEQFHSLQAERPSESSACEGNSCSNGARNTADDESAVSDDTKLAWYIERRVH